MVQHPRGFWSITYFPKNQAKRPGLSHRPVTLGRMCATLRPPELPARDRAGKHPKRRDSMAREVCDRVPDTQNRLRIFIGDLAAELFLECHNEFDQIQ